MATKRVHNPKTHVDMHIAERDSKNYTKGQFTGRYKNKTIKKRLVARIKRAMTILQERSQV